MDDSSTSVNSPSGNPDQSSDEDCASSINPQWLADLSDSDSEGQEPEPGPDQRDVERCANTARMFKLRRAQCQLDDFHRQKEEDLLKASEQLKECREHMAELLEQRERLEVDMRRQKEAENSVALLRVRTQLQRLCAKLQREEELESLLKAAIHKCQLELCKEEMKQAQVSLLRQDVPEEEQVLSLHRQQRATRRLQQKRRASSDRQSTSRQTADKQLPQKNSGSKEKESTNTNTARLMRESMLKVRQEETDRLLQSRALEENRRQAVKNLQSNISAAHTRVKASRQRVQMEDCEPSRPWAGATGPALEKVQKQWQHKERGQEKEAKGVLVGELLQHSRERKDQMDSSEALERAPEWSRSRDSLESDLERPEPPPTEPELDNEDSSDPEEQQSDLPEDLQLPELSGLWAQDYKVADKKPVLVQSQAAQDTKVTTRETGGRPFTCKPQLVHFKDFEVKQHYKKKVVLTNVGYSTNACRFARVSAPLTSCVSISYEPPAPLSHGMSCELQVIFKPQVNEDLEGEIHFTSANGPFSVPVRCSTKKCQLEVDFECLDFGEHPVGRTVTRSITLSNRGALGSLFRLDMSDSMCPVDGPASLGSLAQSAIPQNNQMAVCYETVLDREKSQESGVERSETPQKLETQPIETEALPNQPPQDSSHPSNSSHSDDDADLMSDFGSNNQMAVGDETVLDREKSQESGVEHLETPQKLETQPIETEALPYQPPQDSSHPGNSFHSDEDADFMSDVHFGSVTEGHIEPFQSIKLDIIFKPTIPGDTKTTFFLHFSDSSCPPIAVQVKALALGLPVYVSPPTIDMQICLWDQPYHHWFTVHYCPSRANAAQKLTFKVCPQLKRHMEVVPKTSLVQAHSSCKALLKFQPRACLHEDAGKFFDRDTGVLEAPVEIHTAGQSLVLTVSAVLTTSDISLDPSLLDFGSCSLFNAVRSSVCLTNLSLLPQDFGFCNVPEFMEVQPNDGFGTLLPHEALRIDLLFKPNKAKVYNFQLCCKTGLNRDVVLQCRGVGERPPLELSHSEVQFGATAFGDSSFALVSIINTERPPTPALPRLFCFHLPQPSNVRVSPLTGRLMPGERCAIQLTFRPRPPEPGLKEDDSERTTETGEAPAESEPRPQSKEKLAASPPLSPLIVPCCVSDPVPHTGPEEPPSWSPSHTLYLKLWCPVTQPLLVVISGSAGNTVDFQQVTTGETVRQTCVIKNISEDSLHFSSPVLRSPFSVLNALKPLRPGQSYPLQLAFCPTQPGQFSERLEVRSHRGALWLTLCGEGVVSEVTCSPSVSELDFKHVLIGETSSRTLQLQNHSAVEVGFTALFSSQTSARLQRGGHQDTRRGQSIALNLGSSPLLPLTGHFSVEPAEGRLAPGESQDVRVCFQPEEESEFHQDVLTVMLSNQSAVCVMNLRGTAWSQVPERM